MVQNGQKRVQKRSIYFNKTGQNNSQTLATTQSGEFIDHFPRQVWILGLELRGYDFPPNHLPASIPTPPLHPSCLRSTGTPPNHENRVLSASLGYFWDREIAHCLEKMINASFGVANRQSSEVQNIRVSMKFGLPAVLMDQLFSRLIF